MSRTNPSLRAILSPLMVCAWLFLSVACSNVELEEGSLVLDVSSPPGVKTLLPGTSMVPDSYDFHGAGPGGSSFDKSCTSLPSAVSRLSFGTWRITVNVKNTGGTVIGTGEATVTLQSGFSQSVSITSKPVDGYGILDLTVLWTPADVINPSLNAELTPWSGSPMQVDFTPDPGFAGKAAATKNNIPSGYHTLIVKLLDNGVPVMGAVETVRIVKDGVTSGTFEFTEVNKPAQVTMMWDPNTEPGLAGYKLHYGPSSGNYTVSVDAGKQTSCTITGLARGTTYYITATAYTTAGLESGYSNEVVFASN